VEHAVRGKLGRRSNDARDKHRQKERLERFRSRAEPAQGAAATSRAEDGSDVSMGQGAFNGKERIDTGNSDTPFEKDSKVLDELRVPVGEIGDGALDDLLAIAVSLAQQDGRGRVSIGDALNVHSHDISMTVDKIKQNIIIYMATNMNKK
jgi:hypothetical protein